MTINYNEELENMEKNQYWNPQAGTHKVKFLTEPESRIQEFEKKDEEGIPFVEKVGKALSRVLADGTECIWDITKGKTKDSLWGQICLVARARGGLVNQTLTVKVTGQGNQKRYKVVEAMELEVEEAKKQNEEAEEEVVA